jgi:IS5 family transposase
VMFRMLVLQALDNLSDEQVEYQVRDRLSFTSCWVKRCKPHPT